MYVEELKRPSEWEDFLRIASGGTLYHSLKWKDVIERSFSYPTVYLAVKSENGTVVGVCPAFIVTMNRLKILSSLPYSDFGGPLIERNYIGEASLSLQRFMKEFSREKGISFAKICFSKDGSERFFKTPHSYVNDSKGVVELDLRIKSSTFIWEKTFRNKHRRKIKSFEHDGFQVREASTKSDLRTFLALYYQNMRHLGIFPKPLVFFENVWNLLYPKNFDILLVEKNKTIGGLAFFKYGQTIYLTYLGMDRELLPARYSVLPFLCWRAVKWAEENGFRYVCFGSTPAHPESATERANYSQKVMFGGAFLPQEIVVIPFNLYASTILLLRRKVVTTWKAMRNVLPSKFQEIIERKLGSML